MALTEEQIEAGYSTIPGPYDPVTGKLIETPTSPVRYPPGGISTKQKEYYEGLDVTPPTQAEQDVIRQAEYTRIQAQIDAIDRMYSGLVEKEQLRGEERLGQTRALGARGGILGMPRGLAQMEQTKEFTAKQIGYIEQERNLQKQAIYGKADERAIEEIRLQKATALGAQEKYMGYLKEVQSTAREDVMGLAQTGTTLAELKLSKDYYSQLVKESGWSELQFDSIYNKNLPKKDQIEWKYSVITPKTGNPKIVAYGVDPKTGMLKQQSYKVDFDIPEDTTEWKFDMAPNGTALFYNDKGEIKVASKKGEFAKPEKPEKEKDINEIMSYASAMVSGKIDPDFQLGSVPQKIRADVMRIYNEIIPHVETKYKVEETEAFRLLQQILSSGGDRDLLISGDQDYIDWAIDQLNIK